MPPILGPIASIGDDVQQRDPLAVMSLFSFQTISGTRAYYADGPILALNLLGLYDGSSWVPYVMFDNKLLSPPQFRFTNTLATTTANVTIDNLAGNTVERDGSVLFATEELWGAAFIFQLYSPASETSRVLVLGTIDDVTDNGDTLQLSLKGMANFSEIAAPDAQISVNCQNTFGSQQCGSTSATPCKNGWGNCTQPNRFKGVVSQWDTDITIRPAVSYAQPAPTFAPNLRRPA